MKRCKCESLTKTYDKNNVVYCMVWKSQVNAHLADALRQLSPSVPGERI